MTSETPTLDNLNAWATWLAGLEPLDPQLYSPQECEVFLSNWVGACLDAQRVLASLGSVADRFVEVAQYSLAEAVWREDVTLELAELAVQQSPKMLSALCDTGGRTTTTLSFWMVLVRQWRAVYRSSSGHRLLPAVKSALLEQIRTSGKSPCLRDSAWEGVKMIDEQVAADARAIDEAQM